MNSQKVFISYSHDSESHIRRIFELSERLRSEGIDSNIDQYEMSPPDGWPRWMRNQIKISDFVIIVCTEIYERRFEGTDAAGVGAGAKWEGAIITQQLYEAEGKNTKFIPVVFSAQDLKHIPLEMRGGTWYCLDDVNGYELLYRHLTGQPTIIKGKLGKLKTLPPIEHKQNTVSSFNEEPLRKLQTPAPNYSFRHLLSQVNFKHRYFEHLVYKHRTYRTQGIMTKGPFTLDLEKVFISLRVGAESPNTASSNMIQKEVSNKAFSIWDFLAKIPNQAEHHQHIVVLGAPGSGKTTLLEHLALTYALGSERRHHAKAPKLVPVLLHLRDIRNIITSERPPNLIELIEQQDFILKLDPPPHWFENKIKQKKCLIMLDGLDEVADETQRKNVSSWVNQQLASYATPFILTSRPFGYTSAAIENVGVSLEVQPFNFNEVEQFINNWYLQNEIMSQVRREDPGVRDEAREKANNLVTRIKNSPPLAAMAVNPLLLTMIATIHAIRAVLPGKRVELYAEICDVLLGRRQEAKGIPDPLTSIQKRAVLQVLALALMQRKTREFTLDLGCELIESILSAVTSEGETDPKMFIEQVQNVSGLIVEKALGIYEFAHQSFQEYLAAVQIKTTNQDAILVENIHQSWWSETIRLYAAQGDATVLIRTALEKPSAIALSIAADCLEEAAIIKPEVRQQLERTLREGIESNDLLIAKMAAEVKLLLRLNRLVRVDDDIEIDSSNITQAEYQLLIDDKLEVGQYRQPDHWNVVRFTKGEGDQPIAGIRVSDANEFCDWLNHQYPMLDYRYRLPNFLEARQHITTDCNVGSWCRDGEDGDIVSVCSDDWEAWRKITSVYVYTLKHIFGQDLEWSKTLGLARAFRIDCISKIDISNHQELIHELNVPDRQHIINTIGRHKAHADFLFRELNVNISNVVPLIHDLANDINIDFALAHDLLSRELDGFFDGKELAPELKRSLDLARTLARHVGLARNFAQQVARDLENSCESVSTIDLTPGFNNRCLTNRAPDCNQHMECSYLLLNYFIWDSIISEMKEEEALSINSLNKCLGTDAPTPKETALGIYLCLRLIAMRKAGQISAWEGIRVVRERCKDA
jgi:energy-coupling factor transporter ATP-binding protein EcfA2